VTGAGGPRQPFEYVALRIVPRVDRGEFVNGAVLLYCQGSGFLGIRVREDLGCVRALSGELDLDAVVDLLDGIERTVAGAGPAGSAGVGPRFRWLAAPRSSVLQPGPIHTGLTDDPEAELDRLADALL
jgi:hypothetical protein